jgi:hypothetical protein
LPFLVGGLNWIHLYNCLTVQQAALPMAIDSAAHRPVRHVPVYLAGSGERQLRFDVVGDDGVDDVAVDPAVGLEVDAHPQGRRGSSRHSRFDADADKPGRLLPGFGVVIGGSCDQGSNKSAEQSLSASPGVVDELEESEINGQLLLRETAVRTEPGAQQ